MMIAITIGVAFLIVINLVVCFKLIRSAAYNRNQKIAQASIVFLLPVIGATTVWLFLREAASSLPTTNEFSEADRDDLKTVGMDAPGSYGSPDQY